MDYKIAPVLDNEAERIAVLRSAVCAYAPREERFDRITRMTQRMLHVPIAFISMVQDNVHWVRSAQGLELPDRLNGNPFCAPALVTEGVLQVRDLIQEKDARFAQNPLVLASPYVRSYCAQALELAPRLRVGVLCVLDTIPRTYSAEDLEILADLAHMVESELRVAAMADNQRALLADSSREQRKQLLDPATGCWSERGFEELIRRTLRDVAAGTVHAALCGIQIHNVDDFKLGEGEGAHEARAIVISQFIRQRLPVNAVLCRMPGGRACAMFAARDKLLLRKQIANFIQAPDSQSTADITFAQKLEITSTGMRLGAEDVNVDPGKLLDIVMGKLAEGSGVTSVLS
jgi:GAF domain-containing protein